MGLSFASGRIPSPRSGDVADDRLTARMHMYMLDGDLLLPLAAMPVEGFEQRGMRASKQEQFHIARGTSETAVRANMGRWWHDG